MQSAYPLSHKMLENEMIKWLEYLLNVDRECINNILNISGVESIDRVKR